MPAPLENLIDFGYADGGTALSYLLNARNHLYYAGDRIAEEDWPAAKQQLYNAADDFGYFGRYLLQDDVWYESMRKDWRDALYWINDNWPTDGDEYELTMSKIMDAMWDAKPYQCLLFIPMIDAMRGAIMGKTVTLDYMGKALKRFM